jgi:nucleoside permease NupC
MSHHQLVPRLFIFVCVVLNFHAGVLFAHLSPPRSVLELRQEEKEEKEASKFAPARI